MAETLVERLRGKYRVPITDGLGPAGGEEPDNPNEFVRTFVTPPIQHEAADEITRLQSALTEANARAERLEKQNAVLRGALDLANGPLSTASLVARAGAAEAENARLRKVLGDLVSWFDGSKPVQPVWQIAAGKYGADDAINAARTALGGYHDQG